MGSEGLQERAEGGSRSSTVAPRYFVALMARVNPTDLRSTSLLGFVVSVDILRLES